MGGYHFLIGSLFDVYSPHLEGFPIKSPIMQSQPPVGKPPELALAESWLLSGILEIFEKLFSFGLVLVSVDAEKKLRLMVMIFKPHP